MARFYGKIGFAVPGEVRPGVWMDTIVERPYFGTSNRVIAREESTSKVNDNLVLNNEISVMADSYAYAHYSEIKYVIFMGVKWKVSAIQMQRPRLILNIGDVYNENKEAANG